MPERKRRKRVDEDKAQSRPSRDELPPAGPHATPELTDKQKTPGTGVLSDPDRKPESTEAPTG